MKKSYIVLMPLLFVISGGIILGYINPKNKKILEERQKKASWYQWINAKLGVETEKQLNWQDSRGRDHWKIINSTPFKAVVHSDIDRDVNIMPGEKAKVYRSKKFKLEVEVAVEKKVTYRKKPLISYEKELITTKNHYIEIFLTGEPKEKQRLRLRSRK